MRARTLLALALLGLVVATLGCGTAFKLPNEVTRGRTIPSDHSYQLIQTWKLRDLQAADGTVSDVVLVSQGAGAQLFILSNRGGTGVGSRGTLRLYPLTRPAPIAGIDFPTLFNPVAVASGANRLFVLDQGDTALARDPVDSRIRDLTLYWRVRQFGLLGGDTLTTFTDTTMAFVRGIAADAQGRVYVSGIAIIRVPDQVDPRIITRTFQSRIYRYIPGPRYAGVVPADQNLPGANWHRDSTWVVEEGSGVGTVQNPFGLFWSQAGGPALYVVDAGKNWIQKISDVLPSTGFYFIDGGESGQTFSSPEDITVDAQGFLYVIDTGNRRALRFAPDGSYIQRIDVDLDQDLDSLHTPGTVAADDSLAYVGDRQTGKVLRYKRRP